MSPALEFFNLLGKIPNHFLLVCLLIVDGSERSASLVGKPDHGLGSLQSAKHQNVGS